MGYKVTSSLNSYELFYEEFEEEKLKRQVNKPAATNKVSTVLRSKATALIITVRSFLNNIASKVLSTRKKSKKPTKAEKKLAHQQRLRGILGIGALFVVVSIAYSSYVIFNGVDSISSKIMLIPQVAFATYTLVKAFSKIYK